MRRRLYHGVDRLWDDAVVDRQCRGVGLRAHPRACRSAATPARQDACGRPATRGAAGRRRAHAADARQARARAGAAVASTSRRLPLLRPSAVHTRSGGRRRDYEAEAVKRRLEGALAPRTATPHGSVLASVTVAAGASRAPARLVPCQRRIPPISAPEMTYDFNSASTGAPLPGVSVVWGICWT